eukprot:186109_1
MSFIFSPLTFLPPPDLTWIRTEERGWFRTISWICCTAIMLILLIWNSIKWYQDLFTKHRNAFNRSTKSRSTLSPKSPTPSNRSTSNLSSSSINKKKTKKPPLTPTYKFITTSVQASIFFYFIGTFIGFLSVWGIGCQWIFIFALSSWEMAKGFMYIVFIARLYTAYDASPAYRYPPMCLAIFSLIVGLIAFILAICSAIYGTINPFVRYDHLKQTCGAFFPPELTSTISLFDFLMVFVCVFLFLYPLIRILMVNANEDNSGSKSGSKKIIHLGMKYLIVSSVAAMTSFISLLSITLHAETTPAAWDMSINSICMMLMLPYYSDYTYYNKLCFPCVKLCHCLCLKYNSVYKIHMDDHELTVNKKHQIVASYEETTTGTGVGTASTGSARTDLTGNSALNNDSVALEVGLNSDNDNNEL